VPRDRAAIRQLGGDGQSRPGAEIETIDLGFRVRMFRVVDGGRQVELLTLGVRLAAGNEFQIRCRRLGGIEGIV
jgi:hypothetical protein